MNFYIKEEEVEINITLINSDCNQTAALKMLLYHQIIQKEKSAYIYSMLKHFPSEIIKTVYIRVIKELITIITVRT